MVRLGSVLDSEYPLHDACARGYLDKVRWSANATALCIGVQVVLEP